MEKIEVTKFAGGERSRKHPSEKPHESRFCSAVVRINDTERSRRRVFFFNAFHAGFWYELWIIMTEQRRLQPRHVSQCLRGKGLLTFSQAQRRAAWLTCWRRIHTRKVQFRQSFPFFVNFPYSLPWKEGEKEFQQGPMRWWTQMYKKKKKKEWKTQLACILPLWNHPIKLDHDSVVQFVSSGSINTTFPARQSTAASQTGASSCQTLQYGVFW